MLSITMAINFPICLSKRHFQFVDVALEKVESNLKH
jgi:hypothetical protein